MHRPVLVSLALVAAATSASGQTLQLDREPFNETLRESAEISGAVVAGVQVRAKTPGSRGLDPKLPSSVSNGDTFCLRISSANGLYDAENEFVVDTGQEPQEPMIDLAGITRHGSFLQALEGQEIAAALAEGACDLEPTRFLLSSWGVASSTNVTLLINSFRAETVIARLKETDEITRCQPVDVDVRSAYDTECTFDVSGLSDKATIDIVRYVNRQPSRPTAITLVLPDR